MTTIIIEFQCKGWDEDEDWIITKEEAIMVEVDEPSGSSFMDNGGLDGWGSLSEKAAAIVGATIAEYKIENSNGLSYDVCGDILTIDGVEAYWPGS